MKFTAAAFLATLVSASPTKLLGTRNEIARRQAAEPAPFGYATLNGGTTGGAAGDTVTVSDLASLTEAAESDEPLTIIVSGSISGSAKIRVASDKTIFGEAGSCKSGPGPHLLLSRQKGRLIALGSHYRCWILHPPGQQRDHPQPQDSESVR